VPDYPRQLNLGEEIENALKMYLDEELLNHYAERGAFLDELISAQRDYWAEPKSEKRSFPFSGAATIIIPLSAIAFEAIHARAMTQLFGLKQKISAEPKNDMWVDVAPKFETFMSDELDRLKFRQQIEPAIMEIEKLGTGVAKAGWCKYIKYGVRKVGEEEMEFPVITKQGATADTVPLSRFLMPYTSRDPQTAPWCGEEHSFTANEIRLHCDSGLFKPEAYENLKSYYNTEAFDNSSGTAYERSQEELEKRVPHMPERFTIVEIWLSYDVANNGRFREIVVHYHKESRQIISIRYNWYEDLHRPYRVGVYIPIEHRWTGIGIIKQNKQFQKEITTQHRQRLDNATLANMRMFKVSRMSGYGPNEPIFPGKMWFLDDMTHLESVQLGEIYPSAYNNEQQSLIYSQQRTSVNEVTLGMPQVGTPGTATGDLQRIQEGRKKFDYVFGNIKSFLNEIVIDIAVNIQQYGPHNLEYFDLVSGGPLVKQMLTLPQELIRDGLILHFGLTGEQENDIVDRQNWVQIAGMITQYYTSLLQLAQLSGDGQLVQNITRKGLVASTEAMKQILESYKIKNIDRIIIKELIENAANNGSNAIPNAGGSGGIIQPSGNGLLAPSAAPIAQP
jgi:hypothetical protein